MFAPRASPSETAIPGASAANTSASAPRSRSSSAATSGLARTDSSSRAGAIPRRARSAASVGSNSTRVAPPPGNAACARCACGGGSWRRRRDATPCCEPWAETAASPGSSRRVYRRGRALPAGAQAMKSCPPRSLRAAASPGSRERACSLGRSPASATAAEGSRARATIPYPRATATPRRWPRRSKIFAALGCSATAAKPARSTSSRCTVWRKTSGLVSGREAMKSCPSNSATAAPRSGSRPADKSPSRVRGSKPSCAVMPRRNSPSCSPPGSEEARSVSARRCWATAPKGAVTTAPGGCAGRSSSAAAARAARGGEEEQRQATRSHRPGFLGSPARAHHALEPRVPAHRPEVGAFQGGDAEQQRAGERQQRGRHHAGAQADEVRLHQERVLEVALRHLRLRLAALAAAQGLLALGSRGGRLHSHLLLELLEQLVGADLFRLFLDLHPLRIDVGHRHVHAGLVDRGLLLDLVQQDRKSV